MRPEEKVEEDEMRMTSQWIKKGWKKACNRNKKEKKDNSWKNWIKKKGNFVVKIKENEKKKDKKR